MRVVPKVNIEPADPELYVAAEDIIRELRTQRVMLKFKVRMKGTKEIVKKIAPIQNIALDAEL